MNKVILSFHMADGYVQGESLSPTLRQLDGEVDRHEWTAWSADANISFMSVVCFVLSLVAHERAG